MKITLVVNAAAAISIACGVGFDIGRDSITMTTIALAIVGVLNIVFAGASIYTLTNGDA